MQRENGILGGKRGQVATEFFVTYGWAILIVLAIMTVLYSTVFKPEFYVAERCDIATGLICDNFALIPEDSTHVRLNFSAHNTMGFPINITRIDFILKEPSSIQEIPSSYTQSSGVLQDGDSFNSTVLFNVTDIRSAGSLYRISFSVNFTNPDIRTAHRTAGVINVRIGS